MNGDVALLVVIVVVFGWAAWRLFTGPSETPRDPADPRDDL